MGTPPKLIIALCPLLFCSGCSRGTNTSEYRDVAGPRFAVVASSLAPGQDNVARNVRIRIGFSAWPDPATLSAQSARLSTGRQTVATAYRVDLARCEIVVQPAEPLEAGLTYYLSVTDPLASVHGKKLFEPSD